MKERYIAPELNLLCFAPVENLASSLGTNIFNFDTLLEAAGEGPGATTSPGDIFAPIG